MYETTNRRLEQYLFMNGISYVGIRKNDDGMTVWQYEQDEWFERVISLWRALIERKRVFK